MSKTRKNISIDEETAAALERQQAAGGEASAYLEGLVRDAELGRALAFAAVQADGWHPKEIAAACQALSGSSSFGLAVRPGAVAANLSLVGMADHQRAAWLDHFGVDVETWGMRCEAVRTDDELAAAVVVLARLFWADDAVVAGAVTR